MSKILVVDDDQGTLNLVESCVKNLCNKVFTALDPKIGWEIFIEEKPELVITDYGMPKIDGFVFACLIEEHEHQCPVILVTSYDNIDERLKSQFTHIFQKPILIDDFLQSVKTLLNSKDN
ncbi:MAG: response regulator [Oligoflexales bacterium]